MAPQGASAELAGLTGVWAAVKCLVSIGSKHVDLIKAHARYCETPFLCPWLLTFAFSKPCRLLMPCNASSFFLTDNVIRPESMVPCHRVPDIDKLLQILPESMCSRRWIVRADPEAGLEMFTEMRPALAPETVLPILTNEVPTLCAPYLEAALDMGLASPAKFHNELALIYLRMAKERRDSNGSASTSGQHCLKTISTAHQTG